MNAGYIEVESVPDMICCECGCPEEATHMRYVFFAKHNQVKAFCAIHYREWMIALHGEETVKMLEESTDWRDVLSNQEV